MSWCYYKSFILSINKPSILLLWFVCSPSLFSIFSVMSQWKMYFLFEEMTEKLNTDTLVNRELMSLLDFFSLGPQGIVFFILHIWH